MTDRKFSQVYIIYESERRWIKVERLNMCFDLGRATNFLVFSEDSLQYVEFDKDIGEFKLKGNCVHQIAKFMKDYENIDLSTSFLQNETRNILRDIFRKMTDKDAS